MYLPEYQAKEILAQYGVPLPEGAAARSAEEAEARARGLRAQKFVVKAQIHAGARGLAGGVRFAATPSGVRDAAEQLLARPLVTEQTGPEGESVERVYVEAAVDAHRSLYFAIVVDERSALPLLLGSTAGGSAFERQAAREPGLVERLPLPLQGAPDAAELETFLGRLGLSGAAAASAEALVLAAIRAAFETDAILLELNPVVIDRDGRALAVDAKLVIDDNALYRHPEFEAIVHEASRDPAERIARENEINFVKMQGDIGLVVNGAGLGLATFDMVVDAGGRPANFMDVRTTATSIQIARGVQLVIDDPAVKVVLVNVHGGGMTVCDTVAEGISFAYSRAKRRPRLVVRLAGQNAAWALSILKDRRLPVETAETMASAVARAVALAKSGGA